MSFRSETKMRKVWHREAICGQTRQIISKTKKEAYIETLVFDVAQCECNQKQKSLYMPLY